MGLHQLGSAEALAEPRRFRLGTSLALPKSCIAIQTLGNNFGPVRFVGSFE